MGLRLCFAIGHGHALMLAQVLGPAFHYERLDEAARRRGVFEESPANGSIAAAKPAHGLHGARELAGARGIDGVFDGDEHRAVVLVPLDHQDRFRPVSGRARVEFAEAGQPEPEGSGSRHSRAIPAESSVARNPMRVATAPQTTLPTAMAPWKTSR